MTDDREYNSERYSSVDQNPQADSLPLSRRLGLTEAPAIFTAESNPIIGSELYGIYPYSGCDIKLVVHLPERNLSAEDMATQNADRLEEIRQEEEDLRSALRGGGSSGTWNQTSEHLSGIRQQYRLAQEAVDDAVQAYAVDPTEENQASANTARSRLDNIRSQIHIRSGESYLDLQNQLQALNEERQIIDEENDNGRTEVRTKTLAEVQTISVSVHREKFPVRTLGSVYPRSITRGGRTISGSLVFTTFHRHIFDDFFGNSTIRSTGVGDFDRFRWTTYLTDQLPPMDISISFNNEYGNTSWMGIFGVEFVNEGMVMSIEDLFTEGTAQWMARDYDPIRNIANRPYTRTHGVGEYTTGTNLLMENLSMDEINRRVRGRRNPFI